MTELGKDLLEQAKELERQLTVPTAKLKEITNHFVSELTKGESTPSAQVSRRCQIRTLISMAHSRPFRRGWQHRKSQPHSFPWPLVLYFSVQHANA